jgi:hypothetical protein
MQAFSEALAYIAISQGGLVSNALVIIGMITVASPSIMMRLAFSLIFPHETASRVLVRRVGRLLCT